MIKEAREKLNLKQEDLAKHINEKVSILHKVETGSIKPPIALARKLEYALKISIVKKAEEVLIKKEKHSSDQVTIGDLIKLA
jgi:putative transcription factor